MEHFKNIFMQRKGIHIVLGLTLLFLSDLIYCQNSIAIPNGITDINGNYNKFDNFKGKKIWIVILPSVQNSTGIAFLNRVDSIATAVASKVQTILVPSYEDGYYTDSSNTLINWYKPAITGNIILSQPLYTHILSGGQQSALFNWLTHSSQNGHFDTEVTGTGTMFFIDEQGNMKGVFGSVSMWDNRLLSMMLP